MFLRISLCILLLGGCASLDNVVGGISNTPEWFQERRVQIRGEGYPKFSDVPSAIPVGVQRENLNLSDEEAIAARITLTTDERAEPAPPSAPEDISLREQALRASSGEPGPVIDPMLTEEEIAALQEQVHTIPN